jgi:phosphoribosylanthranilate isomerase
MKKLIKVCGMRDTQNINDLIGLGVDYMGMIFYAKSPRYIEQLPEIHDYRNVKKAGVFVNADETEIMDQVHKFDLQVVQLHGYEEADLCETLKYQGLEVFKAFGISDDFDFVNVRSFEGVCDMFIFDTKTKTHGGSGRKFNWDKLKDYKGNTPFLLSGGISPKEIEEVISFEHPQYAGVDLNSGFEIEPGLKDVGLLKEFVMKYRDSD